jgi:SAM-dependent methyltransferase
MQDTKSALSKWAKKLKKRFKNLGYLVFYHYGKQRWCPVCGKSARGFSKFGKPRREDARCVHCGAMERHRFVWLYFGKQTDLFDGGAKRVLHVAPEKCFEMRLKKFLGAGYLTADLHNPLVMVTLDVTAIPCPNESFDVIYCSHVLEHVREDQKALREFYRVLKQDGWAALLVPITAQRTRRVFDRKRHVWEYGPDFVDRLREAGFRVAITQVSDLFVKDEALLMGLSSASGEIYHCTKA